MSEIYHPLLRDNAASEHNDFFMKEYSNNLLPIQIEAELSKEWTFLSEEYRELMARSGTRLRCSLTFPVESHVRVTSPHTGIEWNIMLVVLNNKMFIEAFYTFYTNEYGEKGIYLIDRFRCSRVTPHYMKRIKSRYMTPKGIPFKDEHDFILFFYSKLIHDTAMCTHRHTKYLAHNQGLSIIEYAGNGTVTYITFVNREMLREYQEPFDHHRKLRYQMKDNPKEKGPRRQLKVLLDELGVEFPKEYSSFKPRRRDPLDTMDISCQIVHTRQVGIPATQETSAVRGTGRPSQQQWFNEEELKKLLKR